MAPEFSRRGWRIRSDPGLCRHRSGARGCVLSAGAGLWPDRRGDIVRQCRLCDQPAGVSRVRHALHAALNDLSAFQWPQPAAWLGRAQRNSVRGVAGDGLAGQPPGAAIADAAFSQPGADRQPGASQATRREPQR